MIALLGFATFKLSQYVGNKNHGEKFGNVLWELHELIVSAVHEAEAVVVREAKAGGNWDKDRQVAVKNEVVNKVRGRLTTGSSKILMKSFGDLNEYLSGQVEKYVADNKK